MLLSKEVKGLNCLYLDGKEINNIYLYEDENHIYNMGRWFTSKYETNNHMQPLELGKVWRSNKLDLTKKRSFYIKNTEDSYNSDVVYDLYIYVFDSVLTYDNIHTIDYWNNTKEDSTIDVLNLYYNGNLIYKDAIIKGSFKRTFKPFGKKIEDLENQLKKDKINISSYDLEKLLSLYDIKRK